MGIARNITTLEDDDDNHNAIKSSAPKRTKQIPPRPLPLTYPGVPSTQLDNTLLNKKLTQEELIYLGINITLIRTMTKHAEFGPAYMLSFKVACNNK